MQFQQNIKNNLYNTFYIDIIFNIFINIFNYFNNLYLYIFNYICKNNEKNIIHNDIFIFLNNIANEWKNNNINDIDLATDILYIYNKYNINKKNINNIKNNFQDEHMKYYILGWYIYQNLNNKS